MVANGKFVGWLCGSGCNCEKTAEWIQMPLVIVVGVEPGIGVLNFGDNRRRGRGIFWEGESLGHSIVSNEIVCVRGGDAVTVAVAGNTV